MTSDQQFKALDDYITLHKELISNLVKLRHGLRLAALLGLEPKDMGVVKTWVSEEPRIMRGGRWKYATLHVRCDGVEQQFKLADVHIDLWPADLAEQYRKENNGA